MHTTPTMVVCDTNPGLEAKYQLIVVVDGKRSSNCAMSSGCTFSYNMSSTPTLNAIFPNAANFGNNISFWGVTGVTDTTNVEMFLGDYFCNMLNQDVSYFNSLDVVFTTCEIGDIPAGRYYAKFHNLWKTGESINYPNTISYDENWNNFSFLLVPQVNSLSSNTGSKNGQIITITGASFGYDISNINVQLDSLPCEILTLTGGSQITCQLPQDTRTSISGIGFSGWESKIWSPSQDINTLKAQPSYPNNANFTTSILSAESLPHK